ncbi:filamentous hemagglutinin N-terminal domain-containing protein [uncultured Anaeromusa sp.]|uniref:two-partner secretion domain-containing protein n=1 Tax=uncultured Anaeromusa sp. TaxID=673273 RepID=UPI0029C9836C|nr:filamentous hemagglutinin N-terminal domain-containing protein [uncultured Anaeromusa sp.]
MQRAWKRHWQRLAKSVLPSVALGALFISSYTPVYANPTGGSVTSGSAAITASGTAMTIRQTTDKVGINWQSFSIAPGEKVQFIQPGVNSVALNRVVGNNASSIYGSLSANGKVYLINPSGILFAPGASVQTGGLVVSTLSLSDSDFQKGRYAFTQQNSAGAVVNQGHISAGEVVLLGPQVKNEGVISAKVAALAAGNKISLDFSGDSLLNVTVDTGILNGSAVNTGSISASGGLVLMSAGTKNALLNTVVNNSGIIRAESIQHNGGSIVLEGNRAVNSGTLDASGKTTGGTVKVLGDAIHLKTGSLIDVSGNQGGGTALIGGNFHGQGSEYRAKTVSVDQGTLIKADALTLGNGGQVAVWSDGATNFAGTIRAQGGALSGDGGQVETSGKKTLTLTKEARVITTAPKGKTGSWLLDPSDYTIGTGANGTNYMNNSDLQTALSSSSITIKTDASGSEKGDIHVNAPVAWSSANQLELSAANNVNINGAVTSTGGGALTVTTGASGNLLVGTSGSVTFSGSTKGKLTINNQEYKLINDISELQNMNNNLNGYYALNADIGKANIDPDDEADNGTVGDNWSNLNSGAGFTPIGNSSARFTGSFDGLGHKVREFTMSGTGRSYFGMFGATDSSAVIRNVGLIGGSVSGKDSSYNYGSLVGDNGGSIINCYSTTTVFGFYSSRIYGGLVGSNSGSIISCYSTSRMEGGALIVCTAD